MRTVRLLVVSDDGSVAEGALFPEDIEGGTYRGAPIDAVFRHLQSMLRSEKMNEYL